MLTIELPTDVQARLEALAKVTGRSLTDHVCEAVLDHLEDIEDLQLAEQRLLQIRDGTSSTTPLQRTMKRYGLGG